VAVVCWELSTFFFFFLNKIHRCQIQYRACGCWNRRVEEWCGRRATALHCGRRRAASAGDYDRRRAASAGDRGERRVSTAVLNRFGINGWTRRRGERKAARRASRSSRSSSAGCCSPAGHHPVPHPQLAVYSAPATARCLLRRSVLRLEGTV
jgi:hypothetical protein